MAVIKTMTKIDLGRKEFIWFTYFESQSAEEREHRKLKVRTEGPGARRQKPINK